MPAILEKGPAADKYGPLTARAFQRLRTGLFYLSVAVFCAGLPFILSFALGYKFNLHTFKFTKTGIIFIKTQPEGVSIYFNNKLLNDKTPASIQELLPGSYNIRLELKNHYPWRADVEVEEGKVSRVDKVILFPLRPDLQQLNQKKISVFRAYPQQRAIYYLDKDEALVYKSDLNGENFQDIASLPENFPEITGWEVSPDQAKLFLFGAHQIAVAYLDSSDVYAYSDSPIILDYPRRKICKVFWHSDSYHLVVVTNKDIEVIEARPQASGVRLVRLNPGEVSVFYDGSEDMLYFTDPQRDADNLIYNNLYKMEISPNLYNFRADHAGGLNE